MNTGVIISTQSPTRSKNFPRAGGTASALSEITKLPIIKMHRDATAREQELPFFQKITNNSLIYITGHGDNQSPTLCGTYLKNSMQVEAEGTLIHWQLSQYRDLIMKNSQLKDGDSITIVLWACHAGAGGYGSMAAQLGRLFKNVGINTRVISSTDTLERFNGIYTSIESSEDKLKFRTANSDSIRIVDNGIRELKIKGEIYFNAKGVSEVFLDTERNLATPLTLELFNHPLYKATCNTPNNAERCLLSEEQSAFILRKSSKSFPEVTMFALSYRSGSEIKHLRYCIDANDQLFYCGANSQKSKWQQLEVNPAGLIETLKNDLSIRNRGAEQVEPTDVAKPINQQIVNFTAIHLEPVVLEEKKDKKARPNWFANFFKAAENCFKLPLSSISGDENESISNNKKY